MCNTLHPSALLPSTTIAGHQETVRDHAHSMHPQTCPHITRIHGHATITHSLVITEVLFKMSRSGRNGLFGASLEQGDRRRHAVKMVFVHVIDLNFSGCGGQKQLPAVLQLAVEPGQAIVVCVDVVVYVVYMHVCSFFCVLAYTSSNLVLQAGRCFNGGVNGGGFDSQNWILTEV